METSWVLIIFGFLSLCFLLLKWNVSRYKNKAAGLLLLPPGEMGFPFLGHTAEFMKDGQHFIRKHRSRYGNIFKTHILGAPTVISVDPELNRFILLNEGKGFLPGYPQSMINILGEYSMMAVHGSLHKTMRGAIFSLINPNMIKDVLILDADAVIRSLVTNWGDRVVDIQKKTQEMIIILGLRQVIGLKQGPRIDAVLAEFHKLIEATFSLPVYLPGTKYYHGYQGKRKIVGLLRESIEEREDSKDTNDDLLGTIRNSNNNGKVKFELSDDQILDLMISFINAGYEAVSTTAMMAVKYLHDNPKALHQLREEHMMIRRGKGETEPINWDDYKQMAFTQAVVYETLRLATVVSGVLRKTSQDMELKGLLNFNMYSCL